MMIPLRVLSASRHLNIAVDVGFVVGMTAQITPSGSAIFFMPIALSSSMTPQVFTFLYALYIYSEAKWFFITLSSTTPIPVSSTAIFARGILARFAAVAAARNILSTSSSV